MTSYIIRMQAKYIAEWEKYGPPAFLGSFNVAPTQQVPILRTKDGVPQLESAELAEQRANLIAAIKAGGLAPELAPELKSLTAELDQVKALSQTKLEPL